MPKRSTTPPRRQTTAPPTQQRRSTQTPHADGRKNTPPFVTGDDLADGPNDFVIGDSISVYQRNDGSAQLFIEVVRPGPANSNDEHFTWGLNCKGYDRENLQKQIGRNILKWPGQAIKLTPRQSDRGTWFVNLYRDDD